jgi:hypothetical protein
MNVADFQADDVLGGNAHRATFEIGNLLVAWSTVSYGLPKDQIPVGGVIG